MRDRLAVLAVTFGGSGFSPVAPGTAGSAAATLVIVALAWSGHATWWLLVLLALAASVINVALGAWIERYFGRKDPGQVVIDECAGQWLTLIPTTLWPAPWWAFLVGFVLFRVFDIAKPLGARRLEKFPRGWGVLLDDVLCGIYAGAILAAILIAFAS